MNLFKEGIDNLDLNCMIEFKRWRVLVLLLLLIIS